MLTIGKLRFFFSNNCWLGFARRLECPAGKPLLAPPPLPLFAGVKLLDCRFDMEALLEAA